MRSLYALLLAMLLSLNSMVEGAFILRDGWMYEVTERATVTPEVHFERAIGAFGRRDWAQAARQFRIVIENFPKNALVPKCYFYLGNCLVQLGDYDLANCELTNYLRENFTPEFLEEAVALKFQIAEALRGGARRRPYCSRRFPKFLQGYDLAIEIYDEIVSTVPCEDIAAKSLFAKGCLLAQQYEYRCAIEAFLGLVRRFPKHESAPEAYVAMLDVYQSQAFFEANNPDILDLAELTYTHFCADYPNDDRLLAASDTVMAIRERYAYGLYQTGQFYERVCKPESSVLYYVSAIERFPDTEVAHCARKRLGRLQEKLPSLCIPAGLL